MKINGRANVIRVHPLDIGLNKYALDNQSFGIPTENSLVIFAKNVHLKNKCCIDSS